MQDQIDEADRRKELLRNPALATDWEGLLEANMEQLMNQSDTFQNVTVGHRKR